MPRARDPNRDKAFEIYKDKNGDIDLINISKILQIPAGTIRGWKAKDRWDEKINSGTLRKKQSERSKRKKGAQPGNKNAVGHAPNTPSGNKRAEKYGFFSKYLPDETKEIFDAIEDADPIDLLWHQIQIAYAAIVRAQRIAYVKDRDDKTSNKIGQKNGGNMIEERWEVQEAWDKQENFMKAQARAQSELRSLIRQYDEMIHKDWDLVTEEQKARIAVLKGKIPDGEDEYEDDGFLEALSGKVDDVWGEE